MKENIETLDLSHWKVPLTVLCGLIALLLLIYYPTTRSFITIWNSSDTFAHGYFILPIVLWLIWRNKTHFYHLQPNVNYYAIPLILLVSFGWLVAYFIDVQVIQQLALVSLIPLVVLGVLGWQVVKVAIFPLCFLIFAVPMGEGLVPLLIEFTADFTVAMVQMTGIPIYREGTFFQLPTGDWSVVEACSGVRYLIASVTLGVLYAYLTYQSLSRRIAFILVSIAVPIIANGLRAFIIVMIGHFSDMQLATGVDHLVYGWVFFGIVIAIMFYIGSFWREDEKEPVIPQINGNQKTMPLRAKSLMLSGVLMLLAVSILPIKAYTDNVEVARDPVLISIPATNAWQTSPQRLGDWTPRYKNMDASFSQQYIQASSQVDLFVAYYIAQREGAQLVTSVNVMVEETDSWQKIGETHVTIPFENTSVSVPVVRLKQRDKTLLVAYFYYLDKQVVSNDYLAKLIEAKTRMLGNSRAASLITISVSVDDDQKIALAQLSEFMRDMGPMIFQSIDRVAPRLP